MDNNQGFPPPCPPPRTVDFQTLCDYFDQSKDVPVTYAFGGAAPTTINEENVQLENVQLGGRRYFVEFEPYDWIDS